MKECTCYKTHINGRCQTCKEHYIGRKSNIEVLRNEAIKLIQKYPEAVKELIYGYSKTS